MKRFFFFFWLQIVQNNIKNKFKNQVLTNFEASRRTADPNDNVAELLINGLILCSIGVIYVCNKL